MQEGMKEKDIFQREVPASSHVGDHWFDLASGQINQLLSKKNQTEGVSYHTLHATGGKGREQRVLRTVQWVFDQSSEKIPLSIPRALSRNGRIKSERLFQWHNQSCICSSDRKRRHKKRDVIGLHHLTNFDWCIFLTAFVRLTVISEDLNTENPLIFFGMEVDP